jgi:hypothetical protein
VKLASRKVVAGRVRLVATCTTRLRTRLGVRVTVNGRRVNRTSVAKTVAANRRTTVAVKLPARAREGLRQRTRVTVAATLTAGGKVLARTSTTRLTR